MNLATLISASAALFQLSTGFVFLAIARAPGWQRARLFSVMSFSGAAYSSINLLFSIPGIDAAWLHDLGVANYAIASIHCAAWLIYTFGIADRPWGSLSKRMRTLVGITVGLGLLALIPGAAVTDELVTISVPQFGVTYRQWATSTYGDLVGVWVIVMLILPYWQFIQAARRGEPWAAVRVAGFTAFFVAAIFEVLVTGGVVSFLYTADFGFFAIVITVLTETVGRVMRDAQSLDEMSHELVRQVDSRTRERDEARDALTHAERLSSLGQLAAGVGHEINNPLTSVRANLEALRERLRPSEDPSDETAIIIDEALSGADRIARVVTDLRAYALPVAERRERVEVARAVKAALKVAAHQLRHVTTVREQISDVPPVYADAVRLSQVLVNLLINAAQAVQEAARPQPKIEVRAYMQDTDTVAIEVEDNGVGISSDALRRLSEPYFSTRLDRGGTGLGLFVANGIVTALGGTLSFKSTLGVGTVARVTLPTLVEDAFPEELSGQTQRITTALRAGTPSRPSHPPLAPTSTEKTRILVVDDEPRVARSIARMLTGMEVLVAESGGQALDLLARDKHVDAVLCDVMMPGLSGADVHAAIASTMPELLPRLFFMTGGATIKEVADFLQRDGIRYIPKPFNKHAVETLLQTLTEKK